MRTLVLLCLLPGAALAHAQLDQAVPPVGSTVAAAPAELQLRFDEAIEPRFSKVTVTDAAGASVAGGAPHADPADPARLLVPVGALAAGTYTVTWQAVSVDTHRTQGSYRFTVAK